MGNFYPFPSAHHPPRHVVFERTADSGLLGRGGASGCPVSPPDLGPVGGRTVSTLTLHLARAAPRCLALPGVPAGSEPSPEEVGAGPVSLGGRWGPPAWTAGGRAGMPWALRVSAVRVPVSSPP